MEDSEEYNRDAYSKQFDENLIKHDLKTVLRRSFTLDNDTMDAFVEFMIPDVMQLAEGYPFPKGKNVYSFVYSVNLRLEGNRRVRGLDVHEARANLLRELTQETTIKDLVSSSMVMPICPIEDIEIKDPELIHGTEPTKFHMPYAYMPRDARVMLEMEKTFEMLADLHEAITPFGQEEQANLIAQVERVREIDRQNWDRRDELDIDQNTISQLKAAVQRKPQQAKELLMRLKQFPPLAKLVKDLMKEDTPKD